ncbi:MAG: hypothetical protein H6721_31035 [Sandaracinus sp.]|nr:hypothetical protein [Myxococcales bacterium]MCB9611464.1 hypothetical protein [Sandaracinus sp.]MCB9620575.1 hypothetical protein [Sandaracinus sp.]MCB9636568.1 hypothetical protein [Sandaracinus sp.]
MHRFLRLLLCLALGVAFVGCGDDDSGRYGDAGPRSDASTPDDLDGDSISNVDEGIATRVDTDGDGTPDYLDPDSDNDGLLDWFEAGDADVTTPPRDADGDGVYDFRDQDSDGNGVLDRREGEGDADGDGTADYADYDDDGDRVPDTVELDGRTEFPLDSDGDTAPDFRDADSDNDFISDGDERPLDASLPVPDVDGDDIPDWRDDDTDGDGISDADEAGDRLLDTPPVDTDEDGIPDFRDVDSDNDGLPDALEIEVGTNPLDEDSDDDGVSDLIEVAAGTDPLDDAVDPRTRGDFVFVVPYREPAEPLRDTLEFRTNIQFADAYFLFDITGSMSTEIAAMKSAITSVIDELSCTDFGTPCSGDGECASGQVCSASGSCISNPRDSGCIASLFTGVGTFDGNPGSYRNLLRLQGDPAETQRRIPGSANGSGGNEILFEAVGCVADPLGCSASECVPGGIGCPSFRGEAKRILIAVTDEPNGCPSCAVNTATQAGGRLLDEDVLFIGVDADSRATPEVDLKAIAAAANSYNRDGEPFYVQGDESAVVTVVTDSIREIALNIDLFVDALPQDLPGDDGDAIQFIDRLEVNLADTEDCTVRPVTDTDGDGFDDAFPNLLPGTPVCWDVVARQNDFVPGASRPQVFVARVVVRGDGSILDARRVFFVVPPKIDRPVFE